MQQGCSSMQLVLPLCRVVLRDVLTASPQFRLSNMVRTMLKVSGLVMPYLLGWSNVYAACSPAVEAARQRGMDG